jgi:carbamoyl-phosphate synthase small subunit
VTADEALLVLEDGRAFRGRSLGSRGETVGEVVFNTSMSGYQEVLTDPSYRAQIVTMTYPHQGNYGVNPDDPESSRAQVAGFVVREACPASSWRSTGEMEEYLREHGIVGIQEIDTRALVRHVRLAGAMMGAVSTETLDEKALLEKVRAATPFGELDLVREVSCEERHPWEEEVPEGFRAPGLPEDRPAEGLRVVAYDFGVKWNLLRSLRSLGFEVTVVPAATPSEDVLATRPDGVFLSNGPGNPERCGYGIEAARRLMERVPLFGVCLGHQLLALALGARTFKLKFGHRGANHPVLDLEKRTVEITSQNHGYAVDPETLPAGAQMTHRNLNDGTCEGLELRDLPVFSVQYHPEACPGPHDSAPHFTRFVEKIRAARG